MAAGQIYPEPTVGALIFNDQDQLLIVQTHKWHGNYTIPGGHIELGEHLLPRLLTSDSNHARGLSAGLINALTALKWHPRPWGKPDEFECSLPVETYHSKKIFSAQAKAIGERLEEVGVSIFRDRLSVIFSRTDKDKYSTIWRPAIEDHEQNKDRDDVENIMVSAFRDALLGYVDRRANAAAGYVGDLLDSDKVLFQRVAIHVVYVNYRLLSGLAEKLLDAQYFVYHYQHEMYNFLQNCFSEFDEKYKQ
ncbi:MAG: NUDIX domain-containing protein, partial [Anaerolineales bacterium]